MVTSVGNGIRWRKGGGVLFENSRGDGGIRSGWGKEGGVSEGEDVRCELMRRG